MYIIGAVKTIPHFK